MSIVFIPLAVTLLFRTPMVQTLATRMFMQWISTKTAYPLTIGNLDVNLFQGVEIRNLKLFNPQGDTILLAGDLRIAPSYPSLFKKAIILPSVTIQHADFRLGMQKGNKDYDFLLFINSFSANDTTSDSLPGHFLLKIKRLKILNSRFKFFDKNDVYHSGPTMNYSDIDADSLTILARDFHIDGDSLHFNIEKLSAKERCGLQINKMQSTVTISSTAFYFLNTQIVTPRSHLNFDYKMNARSWDDYGNFIDLVHLRAHIRPSILCMADLGYFAEAFVPMQNTLQLSGAVAGTISSLSGKQLKIDFGKSTRFRGDVNIQGLPDFYQSKMQVAIGTLETNRSDLEQIKLPSGKISGTDYLPSGENINLSGTFTGKYNNFRSDMHLALKKGALHIEATMKPNATGFALHSSLESKKIDLGSYLGLRGTLGESGFQTTVDLTGKADFTNLQVAAVSKVKFIDLSGFRFKNIQLESHYRHDSLLTHFAIGDKHLIAKGYGTIFLDSLPDYNFHIHLLRSELKAYNILPEKDLKLQSDIALHFAGTQWDNLLVNLKMTNNQLGFGPDKYFLNQIIFNKSKSSTGQPTLLFNSDFARVKMSGNFRMNTLFNRLENLYSYYFSAAKHTIQPYEKSNRFARVEVLLKDPSILGEQFVDGLQMAPQTTLEAKIDFSNRTLSANASSQWIRFANIDFKGINLSFSPSNNRIDGLLKAKNIILKDSTEEDKTTLGLDNFAMETHLVPDTLQYFIHWRNHDSLQKNRGDISGYYKVDKIGNTFTANHSSVYVNDTLWTINPRNRIVVDSSGISINNFDIHSGNSSLSLLGKIPQNKRDTLSLRFNQWNLSNFDFLTSMWHFDLDGVINGETRFSRSNKKFWFISDLKIGNLYFNKVLMGDARILNTWDNVSQSVFIKSQIVRKGNSGKGEVFSLDGFLYPFNQKQNFNINAAFNRFKIKAIEPFIREYVSQLEGKAAGSVKILGTFDKPVLKGFVDFTRTALRINYLNTKYSFSNKIIFDENRVDFGSMVLYDTLGNHATLSGGLYHHYFSNPHFDLTVHANKFLFFDTNRHQNDTYYGTAIADGDIYIKGPPNDISLSIDAKTNTGTNVVIPLDYTAEILDKDYIVFVPPKIDSTSKKNKPKKKLVSSSSKYNISLNMNILPNAKVKIELPYDMGNIQSAGNGNLALTTNSEGDFSLIGDYVVDKGEFNFNIQNLIKKRFILTKGGKISWSGDPYTANLNIKGLYTVKTTFASLGMMIDSSASYKNRLNVNCYVLLSGSLAQPEMRFQIKFPELDPDMQRMVYAQLDTTNQALVNQQMISLLVLGTFSFSNASNISLSSSYYNIISNQLSGLLSKVSKDFDIGVNYKPGDNISQEEFAVALSTQLFDNRLTINGNFGMTYDRSNRTASNLVGDVDINFKLTRDGAWILKAYNHSNVNSWYYYSNYDKISPYSQGVGIAYRKDFNNVAEIFDRLRKKKKQMH